MLKNLLVCIFFACLMINSDIALAASTAGEFEKISQSPKIQETLQILKSHDAASKETLNKLLGENPLNKPVKVMFFDLSQMNFAFAKYDALTCRHKSGDFYILINTIHKNAPAQALACLLAHEALHVGDDVSSYQEEIEAWTAEARMWMSIKRVYNKLGKAEHPLVKRLNSIEKMYVKANHTTREISRAVHSNMGYKGLAEYSPGYGI